MGMCQSLDLLFQIGQLLEQIQDLDRFDGVVQDRHSGTDLVTRLVTGKVAFEGLDSLARCSLQLPQGAFDDLATGRPVCSHESGQPEPVLQGGKADVGFPSGGVDGRLGEQRCDGLFLLPAQFVAVSKHCHCSRLAQMARFSSLC